MHQYKIKVTKYSEEGAITNNYFIKYADTPEQAENICYEYEKQKYETVDEETGEVIIGGKMYKVELYLNAFKLCEDKVAFFAQFKA